MNEEIMARTNFSDIDVEQTAYLTYKPYKEIPGSEDFVYGEERTIVLRNTATGMLEKIDYVLCGGIPWMTRVGYQEFWGEIKSVDSITCYLCMPNQIIVFLPDQHSADTVFLVCHRFGFAINLLRYEAVFLCLIPGGDNHGADSGK